MNVMIIYVNTLKDYHPFSKNTKKKKKTNVNMGKNRKMIVEMKNLNPVNGMFGKLMAPPILI
jgi:hypothetical protein